MSRRRRIGAGLLCVMIAMALLVSSAFILHEAGHDCTGEDCPICRTIAMNDQLLRLIGAAVLMLTFLPGILAAKHARACISGFRMPAPETPVSRKIRLNN